MNTLTPRNALEVVRNRLLTAADDFDRLHDQEGGWKPTADLLREAAQAIVGRPVEPVGTLTLGKYESEFSFPPTRKLSIKELHRRYGYGVFPVYIALPPTAPGASHER